MKAATGLSALGVTLAVAVVVAAAAGAEAEAEVRAGARGRGREGVDAWAVVAALRNISDSQEDAVRAVLKAAAHRATSNLIVRLEEALGALVLDDAELKAAESALKGPEQRSAGGSGVTINAETIRRVLTEGLPSRNIPVLDPFRLSYVPLNANIPDVLNLQASIEDLSFEGLSSFEEDINLGFSIGLTSLTVDVLVDVLLPRLRLHTQYEADASLELGLDIWGDGIIELVLNRLRVNANVAIRGSLTSAPRVNPCDIDISSRGIQLDIQGLFGGGLLSQLVGEIISDMVNDVLGDVLDFIALTVENGVCGYLRSKSTLELIGLLRKITSMPLEDNLA